jgi:hypothetical protein
MDGLLLGSGEQSPLRFWAGIFRSFGVCRVIECDIGALGLHALVAGLDDAPGMNAADTSDPASV